LKKRLLIFSVGAVAALALAGVALAAVYYVRVTPANFLAIFSQGENGPASSWAIVNGPARPPLGRGSLELTTEDANSKQQHLETQQRGKLLSTINAMGYFTYRHPESTGSPVQVAAINMEVVGTLAVRPDGTPTTGGYATFVYEPVYNGAVLSGQWQYWDAYRNGTGLWWSTRDIPDGNGGYLVCRQGNPSPLCTYDKFYLPWAALVAVSGPTAQVWTYGVDQGSGAPNITSNADALYIGAAGDYWAYDFEPGRRGNGGDN
jgi:hypothetical protein